MTCKIFNSTKTFRYSTAFELVTLLRENETPLVSTNTEYMRHFTRKSKLNTQQEVNTFSEKEFIADLERLGLIKTKLSFFERYLKKPAMI